MYRHSVRPWLFAAAISLAACGSDDPTPLPQVSDTGRGDAATDTTGGHDAGSDAAQQDAAGGQDAASGQDTTALPDAEAPDTAGLNGGITILEVRAPGQDSLEGGGIGAAFRRGEVQQGAPIATVGPCEIRSTDEESELLNGGPSLDAGTITVSVGEETHTLTLGADGYTADVPEGRKEFFAPGDTIQFATAGGADIPANAGSVSAPDAPTITGPNWSPLAAHDRQEPLEVTWEGAAGSDLYISLLPVTVFPEPGVAEGKSITCTVPDTGSFTVPVEALDHLPEGSGFGGQTVALTLVRASTVTMPLSSSGGTLLLNATATETSVGSID